MSWFNASLFNLTVFRLTKKLCVLDRDECFMHVGGK